MTATSLKQTNEQKQKKQKIMGSYKCFPNQKHISL